MRKRLRAAFDRFIDVDRSSAEEIARLARQMELDIAVDLGGYTRDSRPGIFAARAAPVQVTFLGYPGTLGAPFMDYLVADRALVPPDQLRHYSEKILHLPSYQPNDATRRIARSRIARSARGGLCVLLLQRQLQDHAGGIRCLDADTEERSGQRPVVAQRG
jgi:predicted O-linked N-acetylglucosamine transferase (SPINDLY family)